MGNRYPKAVGIDLQKCKGGEEKNTKNHGNKWSMVRRRDEIKKQKESKTQRANHARGFGNGRVKKPEKGAWGEA